MKRLLAALVILLLGSGVARADTMVFAGAELSLPDEGWSVREESGLMLLVPDRGGAIIEVYGFSKAPAADRAELQKLVDDRKGTDDVVVASAARHEQHGLRGVAFRGTARIEGKPVAFSSIALDGLRGRAVLAIAFARADLDAGTQREVASALASMRAARAR
jgi:hypothetical protein